MGKFTADGLIPYTDFFDHKGPVVVFIEWLGFGLTKSNYTLLLLQAIFLTFALYGVYKIAKLFLSTKKSVLMTLVTLPVCSFFMSGQGGNTVEEWILPFLVWSSYFAVRFFAYKEKEHNFKYSMLYGITFAFAAFSRITNADFNGKGALSLPDQPTDAPQELKRKFDEDAREVVAPAFNKLVEQELPDSSAAASAAESNFTTRRS